VLRFIYRYSLGRCIRETSFVNSNAKKRLCAECFASEPIAYKRHFTPLVNKHYASVGHTLPQLNCLICNRYLAQVQTLSSYSKCEELFFLYLEDLETEGQSFFDQPDPVLLRYAPAESNAEN